MDPLTPQRPTRPFPVGALAGLAAYSPARPLAPIDLHLDGNEGAAPPDDLLGRLPHVDGEQLRRYPNAAPLEAQIAARLGVDAARVLVTAGGDDAIERACRAVLAPGRELVLPVPTFEMLARFARLAGAGVRDVAWPDGAFPVDAVLAAVSDATGAIAMVSPNNPTGATITAADLRRVSAAAPHALLIVDLAYVEFADDDLMPVALDLPNAIAVRTLSKAWGLAGLRVGYAVGPAEVVGWMRAAGLPYAVSRPSLALAATWVQEGQAPVAAFIARVRHERDELSALLRVLGAHPLPSQANFVLARFADALWVRDALAGLGIGVRAFPGRPDLDGYLRISCPGHEPSFARLTHALRTVVAPEALLFDMDGVLVDVSRSYREAIRGAAQSYGVDLEPAEIAAAKRAPGSNNDWVTTQRLLAAHGVEAPLDEVRARFEARYQGEEGFPGLWRDERLLVSRDRLLEWRARLPLAIVTGRPRADAERFLTHAGVADCFDALVCMEDAPAKPDPAPVRLALTRLGVTSAWMLGDTPDDLRAARAAGVLPLGVCAPADASDDARAALFAAGAARVLGHPDDLREVLP